MKRIIYSCLFFISLLISGTSQAQIWTVTVTPGQCYYGAALTGTAGNASINPALNAVAYTWGTVAPTSGTITYSIVPGTPNPGDQITFTVTGACGVYTLNVYPLDATGNLIPNQSRAVFFQAFCQPTITATPNASICQGASTSLSITGAPNVTWSPGGSTGNPFIATPAANTCYTAIGASAQGCTNSAVSCVSVQPVSLTVAPQTQTVCSTLVTTLTALTGGPGYTYQWSQVPGPALGTASTQAVSVTGPPGTTNIYSVVATVNTCTVSATASVVVGLGLSINVIPSSQSVCPAENFTMTAFSAATSYSWAGIGFALTNFTATGNPVNAFGPGTYTVIGRNGVCTGSTQITIFPTVYTPTLIASSPAVCAGESLTLTASGGTPGQYYFGYIEPPSTVTNVILPVPTNFSIVVTPTTPTIYGVVSNSASCNNTATPTQTLININPPLNVTVTISSSQVCAGSQVTLTATGAPSYTWVSPTGTLASGTASTLLQNPLFAQTYSVYGSNAGGFCTSAPATVAVSMSTIGALNMTMGVSPGTICPGMTASLTATVSIVNANYVWTPSVGLGSPNNFSTSANPTITTVYSVNVDNGGGCTAAGSITLVVNPIPDVSAYASSTAVCAGFLATLTAQGATSYTWMGSTFSTPVFQQTVAVSPGPNSLTPASYTVIGAGSNSNCISPPFVINISLADDLTLITTQSHYTTCIEVNPSPNNPIYQSKPVDFTASGATDYNWVPYNPLYMTYPTGPATTVRPPTSTCYTVIGSTQNCSGKAVMCVTVIPQFTMNVVPLSPVMCLGDSVTLSVANVGTLAAGDSEDWSYNWLEAANAPPPSLDFYGTPTVTAYPKNTTTYTVEMKDDRGCVSLPRLVTVTVLPSPITAISVPTINTIPTRTLCFVGNIPGAPDVYLDLTASNNNPNLPFGIVPTYTWDSPYYPESFVTSQYIPTVRIVGPKRLPTTAIYTVTSGYNGVKGCRTTDTVMVTIVDCRPIIQSNIYFTQDIENDTLCTRECITFEALTDTMAGGPQTYSWTFEGGSPGVSTLRSPVVCYNVSGRYDITLEVTSPYPKFAIPSGSRATKAFRKYIKVTDMPNVTIIPPGQRASDTTIRYGQSIVLTGTNAIRYEWDPPTAISSITNKQVTVNPTETTRYILTGYNSNRCFSSDTINVMVIQDCGDMFVPNAFSPNNDGVNDILRVRGACLQTLTFMVFNRWGDKVFETNDVTVGWDGTYKGDLMNTGVFVYRLEGKTRDGKGYSSKGNITLVR